MKNNIAPKKLINIHYFEENESWKIITVKQALKEETSGLWGEKDENYGKPVLRSTNFKDDGYIDYSNIAYIKIEEKNIIRKKLEKGDILLERSGGGPSQPVGRVAYYEKESPHYYGNFIQRLKPNKTLFDSKFLFYLFNYAYYIGLTNIIQNQTTGIRNLDYKTFLKLKIPVPPIIEQQGIIEVLGTVDEGIRLTDAVIERAQELKRGLMQQLLTRGIGPSEYQETQLGEIPKTWKIVNLEEVAAEEKYAFVDGPFGSNLKVSDYTENGIRIIRLNNIGDGKFLDSFKRYVSETKFNDLKKHAIYPGDIIISEMADPIARACIVPNIEEKYVLTAKSVRLKVSNQYNTNFMMYLINSPTVRNQAKSQTRGSTRPMITLSSLKKLKIPLPPILEQNKISNILCTLDNYFEIINKEKIKYLDIKNDLMQILLSGKIRVELKEDGLHRIRDS